jgi:methylated-DNA-[protein]-cysteine S-methyltransferase
VATPFGRDLYVACDARGVTESRFVSRPRGATAPEPPARVRARVRHPVLRAALAHLDAYFARRAPRIDVPLVLAGTDFQIAVWRTVAALPAGERASYAEVARAIGRPNAHRGVASALGKAPLAIFVPAHRIVGADGCVRGATEGSLRRRLLAFEARAAR